MHDDHRLLRIAAYKLAMLLLQTPDYQRNGELRVAVDAVLAEVPPPGPEYDADDPEERVFRETEYKDMVGPRKYLRDATLAEVEQMLGRMEDCGHVSRLMVLNDIWPGVRMGTLAIPVINLMFIEKGPIGMTFASYADMYGVTVTPHPKRERVRSFR